MAERRSLLITPGDLADEASRRLTGDDLARPGHHPEEPPHGSWRAVPWRTIVGAVAVVLGTVVAVFLLLATFRLVTWVVVAGFLAIVLAPAVRVVQDKVGGRRNVATAIVVFGVLGSIVAAITALVMPIRRQLLAVVTDLPGTVDDAADGRGPIGRIVRELGLADYVRDHEAELERAAEGLTGSPIDLVQTAIGWLLAFVTITLLTFLFLSQSSALGRGALGLVPARRREPVRRASKEAAEAVSGYMIGNLLISLIAGVAAFVVLLVLGVPAALVLALVVAFTDLIPLVGATIGAAVCAAAAFLHEPRAGIVAVVFFVLYQQVENYVIYPAVMARTVKVNPIVVLLGVLVGVELFGIVGALLAVPLSGATQVAIRAVRREHHREQLVLPDGVDSPP